MRGEGRWSVEQLLQVRPHQLIGTKAEVGQPSSNDGRDGEVGVGGPEHARELVDQGSQRGFGAAAPAAVRKLPVDPVLDGHAA